jgi:hypothetical protein
VAAGPIGAALGARRCRAGLRSPAMALSRSARLSFVATDGQSLTGAGDMFAADLFACLAPGRDRAAYGGLGARWRPPKSFSASAARLMVKAPRQKREEMESERGWHTLSP